MLFMLFAFCSLQAQNHRIPMVLFSLNDLNPSALLFKITKYVPDHINSQDRGQCCTAVIGSQKAWTPEAVASWQREVPLLAWTDAVCYGRGWTATSVKKQACLPKVTLLWGTRFSWTSFLKAQGVLESKPCGPLADSISQNIQVHLSLEIRS